MKYAESKNLTAYDVLIIASLIEKEVIVPKERPLGGRRHLQPPEGRDDARDRRGHPLRLRHPADAGDPPEPARIRLAVQHAQGSRPAADADRESRASRRSRRPRTRTTWTSSTSSARPTARAISSRRARPSSTRTPAAGCSAEPRRAPRKPCRALALAPHAERRLRGARARLEVRAHAGRGGAARGDGRARSRRTASRART